MVFGAQGAIYFKCTSSFLFIIVQNLCCTFLKYRGSYSSLSIMKHVGSVTSSGDFRTAWTLGRNFFNWVRVRGPVCVNAGIDDATSGKDWSSAAITSRFGALVASSIFWTICYRDSRSGTPPAQMSSPECKFLGIKLFADLSRELNSWGINYFELLFPPLRYMVNYFWMVSGLFTIATSYFHLEALVLFSLLFSILFLPP